jgi:FKBP-type peptidyl-prolyl cis-trans isomerase FkpA
MKRQAILPGETNTTISDMPISTKYNLTSTLLIRAIFVLIAFYTFLVSCNQQPEQQKAIRTEDLKEPLIRANIAANQAEEEQIDFFTERRGWKMKKTGSGLRYLIYSQGDGPESEEGKIARINYTLLSIVGDVIYTSDESGPMDFLIGKGGVESGLEEAILLLRVGDKAKIIIPSHLGFGLAGDGHKIPPKATLIYDIELLAIK